MFHRTGPRRSGFTLIELLVVIAIMGVLAGMLMQGVQRAREAARRIECVNNMRNMGFAMHNQETATGVLPSEVKDPTQPNSKESFYRLILNEMEAGGLGAQVAQGKTGNIGSVRSYLCPSRRNAMQAPGKRDYGYVTFGTSAGSKQQAILDFPGGATFSVIGNAGGSSNTALMSHVWMNPQNYTTGSDPTDVGWNASPPQNARTQAQPIMDINTMQGNQNCMGSPHPTVMPVLFADNHISNLSYSSFSQQNWSNIWNVFNTNVVTFP